MRRLALAIGLALPLGCAPGPAVTVASPSPSPPIVAASATASPSPSARGAAALNIPTAVGKIPRSFHYLSTGRGEGFRILLFDEESARPPVEVLRSGPVPVASEPDVRSDDFSASADGRVLVVRRRLSEQQTTYSVVRPETGQVDALLSAADLGAPVVSADGSRIAYARTTDAPALHGTWLLAIAGNPPAPVRLITDQPQRVSSPPQPVGWSPDGQWLAVAVGQGESGPQIAVVALSGGETHYDATANAFVGGRARVLAPGYVVDWRGGDGALLITSSRSAFSGRTEIVTADVTTGASRSLYRPAGDVSLGPAVMHPSLDRYAFLESPFGRAPGTSSTVWVRRLDGTATKVAESAFLGELWWSRDGTKLFAITGGDDSTGAISNLLGTGGGAPFCRRGGIPPSCT